MKKRLIVVSLYGAGADIGLMTMDEIEEYKNDVISQDEQLGFEKLYPKVSDLDDIYLIVWKRELG